MHDPCIVWDDRPGDSADAAHVELVSGRVPLQRLTEVPGTERAKYRAQPDCRHCGLPNQWLNVMTKPGRRPITLPHDKGAGGYPIGLTIAIMRQAGLKGDGE